MAQRKMNHPFMAACLSLLAFGLHNGEAGILTLRPTGSTGAHVIAGNSIQILPGGATVDLEVLVSDWSAAPGSPTLSAVCSTLERNSFLGANASPPNPGVDLLPLGYAPPDPNGGNRQLGHFIVQRVCSGNNRDCSPGQQPCLAEEGFCVDNPRWFIFGFTPLAFLTTNSLSEYTSGGVAQTPVGFPDPQNGYFGYVSTLRLVVPPNAAGTYTVGFHESENFTFLNDSQGLVIPIHGFHSARIIITNTLSRDPELTVARNRYVSFAPTVTESAAYRLELISSTMDPNAVGFVGWIGAPTVSSTLGSVSPVVSAPVFRQWNEFTVNVGDCEIMPGSVYQLRSTTDGTTLSSPVILATADQPIGKDWGDAVGVFDGSSWAPPDGFANVNDILAVVSAASGKPTAPAAVRANLQAVSTADSCMNNFVNGADVFMAVLAVNGQAYPFVRDPAACPPCP